MIQVDVGRFSAHTRTLFTPAWELILAKFIQSGPIIGEMTCVPQGATGRFALSYYDD
jgi:hypothetical protein